MIGVTFGTKHSYEDFGLILSSKSIPLPEPKIELVDIPGADGVLDMSTALTNGIVKYKNRPLQFVFTVLGAMSDWESTKDLVVNYIHGQKHKIILDADPAHYYYGRCTVDGLKSDKRMAQMAVSVDADPYKYDVALTTVTDTINGSKTVLLLGGRMLTSPTINCSAAMSCTMSGTTYALSEGINIVYDFVLSEGINSLVFSGTGAITITYRKGSL